MKTLIEKLTIEEAQKIKINNNEYLVWADDSEITVNELVRDFYVTQYEDGTINLEYKHDDFRIEDIIF